MTARSMSAAARSLVLMALAAGTLLLLPSLTLANEPRDARANPSLSVALQVSTNPRLPSYLTARVQSADRKPVSEEAVHFYLATDFLGAKWIHLGQATTDTSGVARIPVSLAGRRYEVGARIQESTGRVVAETITEVTGPQGAPRPAQGANRPLQTLQFWMPRLIGLGVVVIWLTLIAATWVAIRGTRRGRTVVDKP